MTSKSQASKKRIVIIGGGFAGSNAAIKLEKDFDVTLIDTKDYFEFTPGVLRTIVEPEHLKKIQVLHKDYLRNSTIIIGNAKEVSDTYVKVNDSMIPFNYLIIASGSHYNSPFKEHNVVADTRAETLMSRYKELCDAQKILIIGGGIVGVELAGEIIDKYKDKQVLIAHSGEKLIERCNPAAISYAQKVLGKRCTLVFNEKVVKIQGKKFITEKGNEISADLAFLCVGIKPNADFMKKHMKDKIDERSFIKVDANLRVQGCENIFAIGDITNIREEKLAQTSEIHSDLVVENIKNLENAKTLKVYKSSQKAMLISLGKKKGIFIYKNFTLTGFFPAVLKDFVEWQSMRKYSSGHK